MIIIVTGTPGTGKTTLAKKITRQLRYQYLDANSIIKKNKLSESYDKKRHCHTVDAIKLADALHQYINACQEQAVQQVGKHKKSLKLVIDSHMAHIIDPAYVDLCIVTRCDLRVLLSRLHKKKYDKKKITDNMESEIMEVCLSEAFDNGHDPIVVDTTRNVSLEPIKKMLAKKMQNVFIR